MSSLPLIGISARKETSALFPSTPLYAIAQTYVHAVCRAGGLPVLLPPSCGSQEAEELLRHLDGLILSGGGDVDAKWYSATPSDLLELVDPERDCAELALARLAVRCGKPLLAICRGVQVLNVAFGGTLYADIPTQIHGALPHRPPPGGPAESSAHTVHLEPGSRLATILGATQVVTNSFHHQAVHKVGEGLVVTARAPDGVIEGLECPQHPFCLGVQWHPEIESGPQDDMTALFKTMMAVCRAE